MTLLVRELMLRQLTEHTPTSLETLFAVAENHGWNRNSVKGAMYWLKMHHLVVRVATDSRSSYLLAPSVAKKETPDEPESTPQAFEL
jgi:hypothetical protein